MKSRIFHIFDERAKKKGVLSFLTIVALVLVFSACQFDIGQNNWRVPYQRSGVSVKEPGGSFTNEMNASAILSYDMNGDGKNETYFTLIVSGKGKTPVLEYKNEDSGDVVQTDVFKKAEPGGDYSIEAANLEDQKSIFILLSINYHGMPLGSGYWEIYQWKDGAFQQIDIKPVEENLKTKILTAQEAKNNALKAGVIAYLYDSEKYPEKQPVAALFFQAETKNGKAPGSVYYAPMSEYDAEGFRNWGQDAIGKIMSSMKIVNSSDIKGYQGPTAAFLETEEYVFITLPNVTAKVIQYYQYKDGKWIKAADGYIE